MTMSLFRDIFHSKRYEDKINFRPEEPEKPSTKVFEKVKLNEHITYLKQKHSNMIPGIKIIEPSSKRQTKSGIYVGAKHGYFRLKNDICNKLSVSEGDYIVIGKFGNTMLVGKKPRGMFGYELKRQQHSKSKDNRTLFCSNTTPIKDEGIKIGAYQLEDENFVEDIENDIRWLKFKHESDI